MVMLDEGLNRIRDLVSTDITKGTMGTGTTAAAPTDTDLLAIESNSEATLTKTSTDRQIQVDYTLVSTSGTTATYTEYKTHSADTDFDRVVFTGIAFTKNGSLDIQASKKYFFRGT